MTDHPIIEEHDHPDKYLDTFPDRVVLGAKVEGAGITLAMDLEGVMQSMREKAILDGGSNLFDENGFIRDQHLSEEFKKTPEYQQEVAQREAAKTRP